MSRPPRANRAGHVKAHAQEDAHRLYEAICQKPGKRALDYAAAIGLEYRHIERRLVTMENIGLLVFQDERGALWPFEAPDGAKG
jgi:predicted transcriptional regulator